MTLNNAQTYDCEGQQVKRLQTSTTYSSPPRTSTTTTYYLRSSLLGGRVVAELDAQGTRQHNYVYAGGELLAQQTGTSVTWQHTNPITGNSLTTDAQGVQTAATQLDPLGVDVGESDPFIGLGNGGIEPTPEIPQLLSRIDEPDGRCTLDGIAFSCGGVERLVSSGAAVIAPQQTTRYNYDTGRFEFFHAYADGRQGFLAQGARYLGNGVAFGPYNSPSPSNPAQDVLTGNRAATFTFSSAEFTFLDLSPDVSFLNIGFGGQAQNSGFNLGNNGQFNNGQKEILKAVYARITSSDCVGYINDFLDKHKSLITGGLNALDKLLQRAQLNIYDADLGFERPMGAYGVSASSFDSATKLFAQGNVPAVTTSEGVIFLIDKAFQRQSFWKKDFPEQIVGDNRDIDTATIIAHELLHVAGLDDPLVQDNNKDIQEHCGFKGMAIK